MARHERLDGLVVAPAAVLSSVREEPVDDESTNGEDEDEQGPKELVADRTAGLDNLDCSITR